MLRKSLAVAALLAGTAFLTQAAQAAPGYVTETTPMHAGPDPDYPTVRVIHDGREVFIHGCLDDWSWCDVSFHDDRGWVAGQDLAADYNGSRAGIVSIAPLLGIGILTFSFDDYWGRYYHNRPFYSDRGHWQSFSYEHHRNNWGPRPERSAGRPEGGRADVRGGLGGFHGDEGHGRPAGEQHPQVQQDHRQAPENHANIPAQPRAMAPAHTEPRPEHQGNRPVEPEHQQAMPVRQAAPTPQAAPMHQAAPEHPAAAQPQQHHGDEKKKDEH